MIARLTSAVIVTCTVGVMLSAQDAFSPARYGAGTVPALPVTALSGGEGLVEISVGSDGRTTAVTPRRTTPPFTDVVVAAVRGWRFLPATDDSCPRKCGLSSAGASPAHARRGAERTSRQVLLSRASPHAGA